MAVKGNAVKMFPVLTDILGSEYMRRESHLLHKDSLVSEASLSDTGLRAVVSTNFDLADQPPVTQPGHRPRGPDSLADFAYHNLTVTDKKETVVGAAECGETAPAKVMLASLGWSFSSPKSGLTVQKWARQRG